MNWSLCQALLFAIIMFLIAGPIIAALLEGAL